MKQMKLHKLAMASLALSICGAGAATAQQGPVAQSCGPELAKYCADKEHVRGEARSCLEKNREHLSEGCRHALDTTGPGKGRGMGKGMGPGKKN